MNATQANALAISARPKIHTRVLGGVMQTIEDAAQSGHTETMFGYESLRLPTGVIASIENELVRLGYTVKRRGGSEVAEHLYISWTIPKTTT